MRIEQQVEQPSGAPPVGTKPKPAESGVDAPKVKPAEPPPPPPDDLPQLPETD